MIRTALATLAVGTALAAAPASAALITTFEAGAATPSAGYTVVNNFNGPNASSSVTGTGYQILTPPANSNGAPPANSNPAGTPYLSVLGGGNATYTFGSGVTAAQFDWGSIDTYNTLTLRYMLNGTAQTQVYQPGTTGFLSPANGNQVTPGTNGRFTIRGDAGEVFTSLNFASSSNSFEVDNIAAVPEPATWAMMVLGFATVGFGMRRRKAVKTTVQFA